MGEVSPDTESVSESLSDQARPGFRKHDSYIEAIRSVIFHRNTGWPQKYVSEKTFKNNLIDKSIFFDLFLFSTQGPCVSCDIDK